MKENFFKKFCVMQLSLNSINGINLDGIVRFHVIDFVLAIKFYKKGLVIGLINFLSEVK